MKPATTRSAIAITFSQNFPVRPWVDEIDDGATIGGDDFFQASVFFSTENDKFWPILAILSRIFALFGVLLTGINIAVAYQK